jgi:hypothetical protein
VEEAARILRSSATDQRMAPKGGKQRLGSTPDEGLKKTALKGGLQNFLRDEQERLVRLRDLLTGATGGSVPESEVRRLILEVDYVWAHFPEYAAADRSAKLVLEPSFLKRLRAELDPFIKYYRIAQQELEDRVPTRPWS